MVRSLCSWPYSYPYINPHPHGEVLVLLARLLVGAKDATMQILQNIAAEAGIPAGDMLSQLILVWTDKVHCIPVFVSCGFLS